jgi:hypothetical protein
VLLASIALAKESTALYAEKAEFLANKFYNDTQIDDYFSEVFPQLSVISTVKSPQNILIK